MSTLLFDAGNTRIKWALVQKGRLGTMHATALTSLAPLRQWLTRTPAVERVAGVSVAGPTFERRLRSTLRQSGHPTPELMTSSQMAAGVRNGYRDAWRLGDDRWAGAVAAWNRAGRYRTVCAVSIGTALTIDLVDQDGYHRGGLIAPGPDLMLSSLLGNTHGIAKRAAVSSRRKAQGSRAIPKPLADNTHDAIESGSLAAAAAVIDRTINQLTRELGVRPVVFLTGGAAERVEPLLIGACKPCPELVLRGVALLADVPLRP